MKKILMIAAAVAALSATGVMADVVGRTTNNVYVAGTLGHNFATSTNTFNTTFGVARELGNSGFKLYANTDYEVVSKTWNGANIGVTKDLNSRTAVDVWVNTNAGATSANAAVVFSF